MFRYAHQLQSSAEPEEPDALLAMEMQELVGGQFGEMTVMVQYLFQGFNCRMPGTCKDMIMDVGTEEIGHVEMLSTTVARLLEGAPAEVTEKAVATNPVLAAVIGGQNPHHAIVAGGGVMPTNSTGVPWQAGCIVASGELLADFRSNVAAEAQSRLQTSRLYGMTDDPGVKAMLQLNLARDTFHQQQWLLGTQQLVDDGLADVLEDSRSSEEDQQQNHTSWSFSLDGSAAGEGRWASGPALVGDQEIDHLAEPPFLTDDDALLLPPDPALSSTYDGDQGPGTPGDAAGARAQGARNVAAKIKDALT